MDGEPELSRKRIAVWAVESKLINGGGDVLSANFFHVFLRGRTSVAGREICTSSPRTTRSNPRGQPADSACAKACRRVGYRWLRIQVPASACIALAMKETRSLPRTIVPLTVQSIAPLWL